MKKIELPFINLRDVVVYPNASQGLYIGRQFTIDAIQHAVERTRGRLAVFTQKKSEKMKPFSKSDMFLTGTICRVENKILMSDGQMKALLTGEVTIEADRFFENKGVRFVQGREGRPASKIQVLEEKERQDLLRLLLMWNPDIALDEEGMRLSSLKSEERPTHFLSLVRGLICGLGIQYKKSDIPALKKRGYKMKRYPKVKVIKMNDRIKKRQALLEENSEKRQLVLIRELLREELPLRQEWVFD